MARRGVKIISAFAILLVYLMVLVASNMSILLCDCNLHRHIDHAEIAEHHHCSCGACHYMDHCDSVAEKCGCHHDHSNKIELYTFSRDWNDESLRLVLQPMLVAENLSDENIPLPTIVRDYKKYLLPPLSAVEKGCAALRAPPAWV